MSRDTNNEFDEWLSRLPDDDSEEQSYLILHGQDGQKAVARFVFDTLRAEPVLKIAASDLRHLLINAKIGAWESGDMLRHKALSDKLKADNPAFEAVISDVEPRG